MAEIHDDLSGKDVISKFTVTILGKIDPPWCGTMAWMNGRHVTHTHAYGP